MTIYVEDLLKGMWNMVLKGSITHEWTSSFVCNVHSYVEHGNQLSTAQGGTIVKLADNYKRGIALSLGRQISDVDAAIKSPMYRKQPYASVDVKREVRYVGANKLAFRFKKDPTVLRDLKNLRNGTAIVEMNPVYHEQYRVWVIAVDASNIDRVMKAISVHKFQADHDVTEYLTRCVNSKTVPSVFIMDDAGEYVYANICNNPLLAFAVQHIMKGQLV